MRIVLLVLTFFCLFLGVGSVFAGNPPVLINPSNNSIVTSSKMEWQIPSYSLYTNGNPYMVQVDDQSSFANPEKNNIYLINNYYTPQLNPGIWFWRVKAKDSSGTWSDWSNSWSFTLFTSTPSPASSPTPSPTAQPTITSSTNSAFAVSNSPAQINSDQSFSVHINLSLPDNPNSNFYLKGAFKKSDSSNYFGQTKVSGNWVKNGSSYSSQFPITTDSSGNFSGSLEVQSDSEDSGFTGSGDYVFKIGRYSTSGSGPTWSNEVSINITAINSSDHENSSQATNQSTPTTKSSNTPTPQQSKSILPKATTPSKIDYEIAPIAGVSQTATPSSSKVEVKNQRQINFFILVGTVLIFAGIFSISYIYLRNNANPHIKLRRRD